MVIRGKGLWVDWKVMDEGLRVLRGWIGWVG